MANGLVSGPGNLVYVPDTIAGTVSVYSINRPSDLPVNFTLIETISFGMPLDNIATDLDGDMWVPGFPDGVQLLEWIKDPVNARLAATVWKFKRTEGGGWELKKMVEDAEARVLNAITAVRHDVASGRLFMGGELGSFLVAVMRVCVWC